LARLFERRRRPRCDPPPRPRARLPAPQYSQLFRLSGARFVVTNAAIRAIARRALSRGTGTRSLRSIMEQLLQTAMFDVADPPPASAAAAPSASGAGGRLAGGGGGEPRRVVLLDEEGVVKGTGARVLDGDEAELRGAVGEEEVVEPLAAEVR
jgi:hypothetical protein